MKAMPTLSRSLLAVLVAFCLAWASLPSSAQDDGLYEAPVDPNSAFVRVLLPGAAIAVVNGSHFNKLPGGLSPYVNVMPGEVELSAGEADATVNAAPGIFYTLAWDAAGGVVTIKDRVSNDPAKADVYLYNLSDQPSVDLFVPAAKVNAIEGAPAAGSKSVALKAPLKVDVEIKIKGETIGKVAGLSLTRRGGVSVVLSGSNGVYTVTAVNNVFVR
jgi:alginate O-acetyltransferase complex protein AlgF